MFMDLLFHEYSNPYILLDDVISCGRFREFIRKFSEQYAERQRWEFYLHCVPVWSDLTWEEFNEKQIKATEPQKEITKEELETTVKHSYELLSDFNIEERGAEHGSI